MSPNYKYTGGTPKGNQIRKIDDFRGMHKFNGSRLYTPMTRNSASYYPSEHFTDNRRTSGNYPGQVDENILAYLYGMRPNNFGELESIFTGAIKYPYMSNEYTKYGEQSFDINTFGSSIEDKKLIGMADFEQFDEEFVNPDIFRIDVITENPEEEANSEIEIVQPSTGVSYYIGQSFSVPVDTFIESISFNLKKVSAGTVAFCVVDIYEATGTPDVDEVPVGTALARSIALGKDDIGTDYDWVKFDFVEDEKIFLDSTKAYVAIIKSVDIVLMFQQDNTGASYMGNAVGYDFVLDDYEALPDSDLIFKVEGKLSFGGTVTYDSVYFTGEFNVDGAKGTSDYIIRAFPLKVNKFENGEYQENTDQYASITLTDVDITSFRLTLMELYDIKTHPLLRCCTLSNEVFITNCFGLSLRLYDDAGTLKIEIIDDAFDNTIAAITYKNRIYSITRTELHISALSDMTTWSTSAGILELGDAGPYSTKITNDNLTAIKQFQNKIIIFTENNSYYFYGDYPSNFYFNQGFDYGTIRQESVHLYKGSLYFLSNHGLMKYAGYGVSTIAFGNNNIFIKQSNVIGYEDMLDLNNLFSAGIIEGMFIFNDIFNYNMNYDYSEKTRPYINVFAYDIDRDSLFVLSNGEFVFLSISEDEHLFVSPPIFIKHNQFFDYTSMYKLYGEEEVSEIDNIMGKKIISHKNFGDSVYRLMSGTAPDYHTDKYYQRKNNCFALVTKWLDEGTSKLKRYTKLIIDVEFKSDLIQEYLTEENGFFKIYIANDQDEVGDFNAQVGMFIEPDEESNLINFKEVAPNTPIEMVNGRQRIIIPLHEQYFRTLKIGVYGRGAAIIRSIEREFEIIEK